MLYYIIALLGLIWAGFNSYLELLEKIPSEARPINPEISIMFEEGHEYSYSFDQSEIELLREMRKLRLKEGEEYIDPIKELYLPKSQVTFFIRLENIGLVSVNLLTINGKVNFEGPYRFMIPDVYLSDGTQISYPILLQPKEILHLNIINKIFPNDLLSNAQIAARTRNLLDENKLIETSVSIEFTNPEGKVQNEKKNNSLSLTPLCRMYVTHWENIGRNDLVKLATG
jgi:hypothetical protein